MAASILNVNRAKGQRAFTPEDFVPKPRNKRPQTAVQMANILKAYTLALGGEVTEAAGVRS